MSKTETVNVEFYDNGKLVKTMTDIQTARAINKYNEVYNKIQYFDIQSGTVPAKHNGFVCQTFVAKHGDTKIVCAKEFLPNVPEILSCAQYKCGVKNTKDGKFENVGGGVQVLYYKLFSGHTK